MQLPNTHGDLLVWAVQHPHTSAHLTIGSVPPETPGNVAIDYGLPTAPRPQNGCTAIPKIHFATMQHCSCQFPTCWGLPCRHMLALYHTMKLTKAPASIVADRWYAVSRDEAFARTKSLLMTAYHGSNNRGSKQSMSQQERYAYLMAESKAVIELASLSNVGLELFQDTLTRCKDMLREVNVPSNLFPIHEEDNNAVNVDRAPLAILNPPSTHRHGKPQSKRKHSAWEK